MLKIGWSKREISLKEPVNLFGQMYMRISEGIMDPCYATALCVDGGEGNDTVIFCSCDLEGLRCDFIERTKRKAREICSDVPVDGIVINVTHTHAGGDVSETPEIAPDGMRIFSGEEYRDFVTQQCAEAICEAWTTRALGGMSYGYGYAVVGHSRRIVYLSNQGKKSKTIAPNGHGVTGGNTNDPEFSHYEAGADHTLNLMFTFDEQEKLTGIVVNIPCPSQTGEHFWKMSADYWTDIRQMVAKEYGEEVFVLPQCAAAGDLGPRIYHYKEAQKRRMELKYGLSYDARQDFAYNKIIGERMDIGERVLDGIREVYAWARKDIQTDIPVRHECRTIEVERRLITEEERDICAENYKNMSENPPNLEGLEGAAYRKEVTDFNSIVDRNKQVLERYEDQKECKTVSTIVHTTRIGDIAFATNRFEMYMDFMHRIQARSPFIQTFVIQLAGDEGANYISTERGYRNKGYGSTLFDNKITYEGGQQLVNVTLDMLENIK